MKEIWIVDGVRTPIGRYKGSLKSVRPDDMAASVIQSLLDRHPQIPVEDVEEVVLGCANQAGEDNRNVARMAALLAGLPPHVSGVTINRLCGSGLDAVNYAARGIAAGEGDIYIAGGVESMTRAPFVMGKPESEYPRGEMKMYDTTIGWRFINARLQERFGSASMPQTAQIVADRYSVSREEQDLFAFQSQQKAKFAVDNDFFANEIVPLITTDSKGNQTELTKDEHPRPEASLEKLASLQPLFPGGTVTAGNASGVNDGASVLLLMSAEKGKKLSVTPMAKVVSAATYGVEPDIMGLGPIGATKKALKRAGLTVDDLDLVELNEAFASQSLQCIKELALNTDIVNVNGGAIALGHPLGASGARILTTLIHEMQRRKSQYGLATMCVGVGQGISMIIKRIE